MIEGNAENDRRIVTIFDDIYDLTDSRSYYRAMDGAGFRTAHHAAAGFRAVLDILRQVRGGGPAGIVDFACGYGIGGALLRHEITLDDMLRRYRDAWFDTAPDNQVIQADAEWLAGRRRQSEDRYTGIDIAGNAVAYARAVGIFDKVFAENLQADEMSDGLRDELARADLIIECGSVAHMLPGALDRILSAAGDRRPWIVTAPIRGNDSAEAFDAMRDHGLVAERISQAPFRHRRFADPDEQARAIANAQARGHVTDGFETEGYFHAELYLARPADEVYPLVDWTA